MPATYQNTVSQDNTIKNQTVLMIDGQRVQLNFLSEPCHDNLNFVRELLIRSFFDAEAKAKKI